MVRRATLEDMKQCVDLARRFHAQSIWSDIPFDEPSVTASLTHTLTMGVIFLNEDGFLGAIPAPLLFNQGHVIAYEQFWFAGSDGQALIRAYEAWADDIGAYPLMVCLEDERADLMTKLFKRRGYTPAERYFVRR